MQTSSPKEQKNDVNSVAHKAESFLLCSAVTGCHLLGEGPLALRRQISLTLRFS